MSPAEIRLLLLTKLVGTFPYAVSLERLGTQLAAESVRLDAPALLEHLRSLADERMALSERSRLDQTKHCWRATEHGRSWLAAQQET